MTFSRSSSKQEGEGEEKLLRMRLLTIGNRKEVSKQMLEIRGRSLLPGICHLSRQTGGNLRIISLFVIAISSLIQLSSLCLRQLAYTFHIDQLSKKKNQRNRTDHGLYLQVSQNQHYPDTSELGETHSFLESVLCSGCKNMYPVMHILKIKKSEAVQICDLQESSALESGTGRLPQCQQEQFCGSLCSGTGSKSQLKCH